MIVCLQASGEAYETQRGGVNMFTTIREQVLSTLCRMLISRAETLAGVSACECLRLHRPL